MKAKLVLVVAGAEELTARLLLSRLLRRGSGNDPDQLQGLLSGVLARVVDVSAVIPEAGEHLARLRRTVDALHRDYAAPGCATTWEGCQFTSAEEQHTTRER